MARPGLSYQDIVNAIEQLIAEGSKPTINSIRETIGRGSPTTISKFLKQWRTEKEKGASSTQASLDFEQKQQPAKQAAPSKPTTTITKMTTTKNTSQLHSTPSSTQAPLPKTDDPIVNALLSGSNTLSDEMLSNMSDEWDIILNESNVEIKVRKLYAALVKEQTRRVTAEQVATESKLYADATKEQTTLRISDLRDSLESQIAFLNGQIRQLKREAETNLEYYRTQLEKANNALATKKS